MKNRPAVPTYNFYRPDRKTMTAHISFGVSRLQLARKLIHEIHEHRTKALAKGSQ